MSDSNGQSSILVTHRIENAALKIMKDHPQGIRWSELVKEVERSDLGFKNNTVQGVIYALSKDTTKIRRPARGILVLAEFVTPIGEIDEEAIPQPVEIPMWLVFINQSQLTP